MPPVKRARKRKRQAAARDHRKAPVSERATQDVESADKADRLPWYCGPFSLTMASGLVLWAAFPPLDWWPLAWIAPLFWLVLIRRERLGDKRPYLAVWLGCTLHWLIMLYGIRLAHPALNLGWVAMSAYLAVYPLLFIGLARVAVHRLRISIVLAAPTVWTGMELARGYAITGFSMALLGHTQVRWTTLIQMSDIFGAYGVSFLVMFVAASAARMLPTAWRTPAGTQPRFTLWPLPAMVFALAAVVCYGKFRLRDSDTLPPSEPALHVALVQCSFDTSYELDLKRSKEMLVKCLKLSRKAVADHPNLDLVVWPESAFTGRLGDIIVEGDLIPPEDFPLDAAEYEKRARDCLEAFPEKTADIASFLNRHLKDDGNITDRRVHLVAGTDTRHLRPGELRRYNTALFVGPNGKVLGRYHKMHLVPFGEYILLGDIFPWVYRLTPMTHGLSAGEKHTVFEVSGVKMAPSICFESTVPHLIRGQIAALRRSGQQPDVLVNVTNDGWFKGSSILDFHLACAAFRAVENRLPVLVAANTGFSAYVDGDGRIVKQGPRRAECVVYAAVERGTRHSWYQRLGDMPAGACLLFCVVSAIFGVLSRLRRRKAGKRRE